MKKCDVAVAHSTHRQRLASNLHPARRAPLYGGQPVVTVACLRLLQSRPIALDPEDFGQGGVGSGDMAIAAGFRWNFVAPSAGLSGMEEPGVM